MKQLIKVLSIISFMIFASSCAAFDAMRPTNHDVARYPTYHYAIDSMDPTDNWTPEQRSAIVAVMSEANRFGPTFVLAQESDQVDFTFYKHRFDACGMGTRFVAGTRIIDVDPGCTEGLGAHFRWAVLHSVGRFLGMEAICTQYQGGVCSPVGYGLAVMNTNIDVDEDRIGLPSEEVTPLDIAEFRRVWALRHK